MAEEPTTDVVEDTPDTDAPDTAAAEEASAAEAAEAAAAEKAARAAEAAEHRRPGGRGARKVRDGVVVSDKMDKTVVVLVERRVKHPRYHKTVTRSKRIKAHDETNEAGIGDRVRIVETRPLSKTKRFRVASILERAE